MAGRWISTAGRAESRVVAADVRRRSSPHIVRSIERPVANLNPPPNSNRIWQRNGGKGMKTRSIPVPLPLAPFLCQQFRRPPPVRHTAPRREGFSEARLCAEHQPQHVVRKGRRGFQRVPAGARDDPGLLRLVLGGHSRAPRVVDHACITWPPSMLRVWPVMFCA